jgi:phage gp29-like protein
MLYDWTGKAIDETKPIETRLTSWEPADRQYADVTFGLTPTTLEEMFQLANRGDPRYQARLTNEIQEKDWDAVHALGTRVNAVTGLEWSCEASDEKDKQAVEIAEHAELVLRQCVGDPLQDVMGFQETLGHIMGALLPGYSGAEILWGKGGATIDGFGAIPPQQFIYIYSINPLIWTYQRTEGFPILPNKFVFHRHVTRSGDPSRGGLIRPLGWMFVFQALGVRDVMRYVEKFGMPFVSARVDESAWERDRNKIAALIRNFGSDGGACFSKAVEIELLDGSKGAGGDIYFKLLQYFGDAKTKVILGQLASSGEGRGWSKGGAQAQVRQDILESDGTQLNTTVKRDVLRPWTMFNYGPDAPVPDFLLDLQPPEDHQAHSTTVATLAGAGYQADPEWVEKEFGIPLVKGPDGKPLPPRPTKVPGAAIALTGEHGISRRARGDRRAGRSHRLATAQAAQAANDKIVEGALAKLTDDRAALRDWLSPVQEAIAEACAGMDPLNLSDEDQATIKTRLRKLLKSLPGLLDRMDTRALEEHLSQAMFAADTNGRIERAAALGT